MEPAAATQTAEELEASIQRELEVIMDRVRALEWRGGPGGPRARGLVFGVGTDKRLASCRVRRNWPGGTGGFPGQGYYEGLALRACRPREVSRADSGLVVHVGVITESLFAFAKTRERQEHREDFSESLAAAEASGGESWLGDSISLIVAERIGTLSREEARGRAVRHGLQHLADMLDELPA